LGSEEFYEKRKTVEEKADVKREDFDSCRLPDT
jgi:hypothetical protein